MKTNILLTIILFLSLLIKNLHAQKIDTIVCEDCLKE